jgi:hypothetical protein
MTPAINELIVELRLRRLEDAWAMFEAAHRREALEALRRERKEAAIDAAH